MAANPGSIQDLDEPLCLPLPLQSCLDPPHVLNIWGNMSGPDSFACLGSVDVSGTVSGTKASGGCKVTAAPKWLLRKDQLAIGRLPVPAALRAAAQHLTEIVI